MVTRYLYHIILFSFITGAVFGALLMHISVSP